MAKVLNRITKSILEASIFDKCDALIDATISYNQGDLLVLDTAAHLIKPVAAGELGAAFLGISRQSIVLGKPLSPYIGTDVDAAQAIPALVGPAYGVIAKLVAKTGDAFVAGALVYIDGASGTHHVTSTKAMGAVAIGVYQGATIAAAAAGQEIEILLNQNYL